MSRKFFSGGTLEQAVLAAARHYDIEPEQVAYTERDKKHGFLNVRRKVVIEVDPEAPKRAPGEEVPWQPKLAGRPERRSVSPPPSQPPPSQPPPSRPSTSPSPPSSSRSKGLSSPQASAPAFPSAAEPAAPPAKPREEARPKPVREPETDDPLEAADQVLGDIADFLLFDLEWEIHLDEDDTISVDLDGEDSDRLIDDDGALLRAIEQLMPRLMHGKLGHVVPCSLDCAGFNSAYEKRVRSYAAQVAEEVRKTRTARLLDPMSPADRRLVHITLADDPTVETESEGHGFTKRVRVRPTGQDGEARFT